MKSSSGASWVFMVGLFVVGMAVLVGAAVWDGTANNVVYGTSEEILYIHNLSANVTGVGNGVAFSISPGAEGIAPYIYWNDVVVDLSEISDWISIENASTGNLTINALYDNQTGFFRLPLRVAEGESSQTETFNFTINATNDEPTFVTSEFTHNWSSGSTTNYTVNFLDEEEHYPLNFSLVNVSCDHPGSSDFDANESCEVFTVTNTSNSSVEIGFNYNSSLVGTYIFNLTATEADHSCPHDYCDNSTYNVTRSVSQLVTFEVQSSLSIDVSNCTGQVLTEDEEFNCTVVITTQGATDPLNLSTFAFFRADSSPTSGVENTSWFYVNNSVNAENFNYNATVSVTPRKEDVGNFTINFTAVGGETVVPAEPIYVYVNFTEEEPSLDIISDRLGVGVNQTFNVNGYDNDLLIRDDGVKNEQLTYVSNTSWVSVTSPNSVHTSNSTISVVSVNFDYAKANSFDGNNSILINVTDEEGNFANRTFVVEILDNTAPEWNDSLSELVNLSLVEDDSFFYNVSMNISDAENDSLTFYYENISGEFCSLNASTFNATTGVINFTPTDCDVGYHNVTIVVQDNKSSNSTVRQFNFTVENVDDVSEIRDFKVGSDPIDEGDNETLNEGTEYVFELVVDDDDFLIPSGQRDIFYNESLVVDFIFTNSSDVVVDDLFEVSLVGVVFERATYNASFTPTGLQSGNFTVFVNITDASFGSINRSFVLNVSATPDAPNLTVIANQSFTVHDYVNFTVNASDDEDDRLGLNLAYSILNVTAAAPNLTIGNESGVVTFNTSSNESYAGIWEYNVTVTDSAAQTDTKTVYVYIYGNHTLISPALNYAFSVTENIESILNFTINHSIGDNLTYEFWIDTIACAYQNNSNCTYGNSSLRETTSSFGNATAYNWTYVPSYSDETYELYKNLTLSVYPNTTALNSTQRAAVATNFSFSLNVSHTNAPIAVLSNIPNPYPSATYGSTPIDIALGSYFTDVDYSDTYYAQNVTFNISTSASGSIIRAESNSAGSRLPWNGLVGSWSLQLYGESTGSENVTIIANDSFGTASNGPFIITFSEPSVISTPTPSSGGGTKTKLKHYSLKLIVPQDIIISERNYIDIPFSIQNNGQMDLNEISLSSFVRFNNVFSDDVKISLEDDYIDKLKFGQSQNFSMRIRANIGRAGKYKATIFANVTSPKFSDWADFFIEIKKANESEAEQILIFTEKLIADNPECLELTELINRAKEAFGLGEFSNSLSLAEEAVEACEDSIESGNQVRFGLDGFVEDNFYYISFATLVIFFVGFVFYIYKRVRFNKSGVDEYV